MRPGDRGLNDDNRNTRIAQEVGGRAAERLVGRAEANTVLGEFPLHVGLDGRVEEAAPGAFQSHDDPEAGDQLRFDADEGGFHPDPS